MADAYPNDKNNYYQKFLLLWSYVNTYLVDHVHGDWYEGGLDKEPEKATAQRAISGKQPITISGALVIV